MQIFIVRKDFNTASAAGYIILRLWLYNYAHAVVVVLRIEFSGQRLYAPKLASQYLMVSWQH